jgi:adenosylhomocysteine nucleosidase
MNRRKCLILTALDMEAKAIAGALGKDCAPEIKVIGIRGVRLGEGWLGGKEGIILAGLAGALDPSLGVGDVIASIGNGEWPDLSFRVGAIHTSADLVTSAAAKGELFRQTGALAVDMEQKIVSDLARKMNLPMLGIRAISDRADESLDADLMRWVDETGRPKVAALAAGLAKNPLRIRALIRLGRNSRLAAEKMAAAVRLVLEA